jgi:tetratricopeptide (TPR) repeat protein
MAAAFELNWGRQDQAAVHAQRALDVNARCALAHRTLARLAATAENYEEAIAHCDRALAVSGWDAEARALRAACFHVLGRQAEFQRDADQYALQHVGDGGVPHAVAAVLEDQRRFAEAAEWEGKAIAIDPTHWGAWVNRGMNLLRVGDEVEGKKALDEGFRHYKFDVHAANMLTLLRKLDGFVTRESDHFRLRFDPSEEEIMAPYCIALLERGHAELGRLYGGFTPEGPVLFEMFPDANDFAVRTLGLPGLGALGACFGKVVTIDSPKAHVQRGPDGEPRPAFNWAATAWHEFAHVMTLQLSQGRVPRWFTEGLSEFEEYVCRPEWTRPLDEKLYGLWKAGRLTPIAKLNNDFMGGDIGFAYFYAGWICRFLAEVRGRPAIVAMLKAYGAGQRTEQVLQGALGWAPAEFDTQFAAWLGGHLGGWRLPAWYGEEDRAAFKRELAARPEDAALIVKMARAYWQARNVADAEIHAGRAADLDPQNGEALFLWSEIARAKGRTDVADRRLAQAFERGFDDFYVRLRLAEKAEGAGDQAALLAHLEAAHRHFPRARGDASPAKRLATLYAQAGRDDDARTMRMHMVALLPEDVDGREQLLEEFRQRGDRERVLQYCEEINNIDPFRLEHHLTWSTALREAGRLAEAVREGEVGKLVAEQTEDRAMNRGQHQPAMAVATGRACAVLGLAYVAQRALDGARDMLAIAEKRAPEVAETKQLAEALAKADAAPGDGAPGSGAK